MANDNDDNGLESLEDPTWREWIVEYSLPTVGSTENQPVEILIAKNRSPAYNVAIVMRERLKTNDSNFFDMKNGL